MKNSEKEPLNESGAAPKLPWVVIPMRLQGDTKRELRVSCYTDARYLTDAEDLKSQTGYVFILNGAAVD
nr:hypothetical protein [Tanacetum cinerariifolium]